MPFTLSDHRVFSH